MPSLLDAGYFNFLYNYSVRLENNTTLNEQREKR